jgi:predicted alpha/beta hydrolase
MNTTAIVIVTEDGAKLGAHRFEPSVPAHSELLMAGATAVPQGFYHRFARHANEAGFAVTTVDYRGIGQSAPPKLRGFKMNYLDWARQDLVATLHQIHLLKRETNPIFMMGHSYGGHALGLMPNQSLIKKFYGFAVGAGWSGYMPPLERLKVNFLWNVLGPIITPITGYMPGKMIGGENLPIDVYHQWRRWCKYPNYFFDDPNIGDALVNFERVRLPIVAATADDDLWAPPSSRDAFFRGYKNAHVTHKDVKGTDFGPRGIGHMGYFRRGSEKLWDEALQWYLSSDSANHLDEKSQSRVTAS